MHLVAYESLHQTVWKSLTLLNEPCSPWKIHEEKEEKRPLKFWKKKRTLHLHPLRPLWSFIICHFPFFIFSFNESNLNEQRMMSDGKEQKWKGAGSDISLL